MCHNYGTTTEHATALHGMNPMVCAGCHNKYGRSDMMSSKHWSDYVIHAIGPTVATRTSSIWHVWCALCRSPPSPPRRVVRCQGRRVGQRSRAAPAGPKTCNAGTARPHPKAVLFASLWRTHRRSRAGRLGATRAETRTGVSAGDGAKGKESGARPGLGRRGCRAGRGCVEVLLVVGAATHATWPPSCQRASPGTRRTLHPAR